MADPVASGFIVTTTPAVARYRFHVWDDGRVDVDPDVDRGYDDDAFRLFSSLGACASPRQEIRELVAIQELSQHHQNGRAR